jgi:hypothetical protein
MISGRRDAINHKYRAFIEDHFTLVPGDADEKIIGSIISVMEMATDKRHSLKTVLDQVARLIFRHFDFREVGIGLKSRTSDVYKYEVLIGFMPDIVDSFRKLKYTHEEMVSQERFPSIKTGRLSGFYPVEGLSDEDRAFFNRPFQLRAARESSDKFHEGDYFDVWMYGPNKELIGWIEMANPVNGKIPPKRTIRWIELIASICSSMVIQRWAEESPPTK